MKTHLFINPYKDKNPERQKELKKVFENNLNAGFDHITFVIEEKDYKYVYDNFYKDGIDVNFYDSKPSFQTYIDLANLGDNETINIVCNSDIYITSENLEKIKNLPWNKNLFAALSRYDVTKLGNLIHLDRQDSADFWAWKGNCNIENMNCPLGFCGVDNHLVWKAKEAGYVVVNPSKDIITCHLHNVLGNNYRDENNNVKADQICPEPYHFHPPIFIKDI